MRKNGQPEHFDHLYKSAPQKLVFVTTEGLNPLSLEGLTQLQTAAL